MAERKMHSVSLEVKLCVNPDKLAEWNVPHAAHVYHIDLGSSDRYHWCPGHRVVTEQPERQ